MGGGIAGQRRSGKGEGAACLPLEANCTKPCLMIELLRTTDAVLLSFVGALLNDADIPHMVADGHMSVLDGSIGVLPRRMLVDSTRLDQARRLLRDADLGHELS